MLRAMVPLLMLVACLLSQYFFPGKTGTPDGKHAEFRIGRGIRVFAWIAGIAMIVWLALLTPSHSSHAIRDALESSVFAGAFAMGGVWADKYALTFWDDHLTYGAFNASRIDYKDILSAAVEVFGRRSRYLVVRTATRRFKISGSIHPLQDAVWMLESKMKAAKGGGP